MVRCTCSTCTSPRFSPETSNLAETTTIVLEKIRLGKVAARGLCVAFSVIAKNFSTEAIPTPPAGDCSGSRPATPSRPLACRRQESYDCERSHAISNWSPGERWHTRARTRTGPIPPGSTHAHLPLPPLNGIMAWLRPASWTPHPIREYTPMTERPRSKPWTREEWERQIEEERRAEAARPPVVALGARVQVELVDERGAAETLDLVLVPDADADLAVEHEGGGPTRQHCTGCWPRCATWACH